MYVVARTHQGFSLREVGKLKSNPDLYKTGESGRLTEIYKAYCASSPASQSQDTANAGTDRSELAYSAILLNGGLFNVGFQEANADLHQKTVRISNEFELAVQWCERCARDGKSILMIGDGRNKSARNNIDNRFDQYYDETKRCDLWTTYSQGVDDIRDASRNVAFSANATAAAK